MFKYKTDAEDYIVHFRARIIVRGDLQEDDTILLTYAATLAACSFRIAIVIAIYFDLEMKLYKVVNAFINVVRKLKGPLIIC